MGARSWARLPRESRAAAACGAPRDGARGGSARLRPRRSRGGVRRARPKDCPTARPGLRRALVRRRQRRAEGAPVYLPVFSGDALPAAAGWVSKLSRERAAVGNCAKGTCYSPVFSGDATVPADADRASKVSRVRAAVGDVCDEHLLFACIFRRYRPVPADADGFSKVRGARS
jgi:hypothetical protein